MIVLLVLVGLTVLMCGGPLTWWFARRSAAFAELEDRREEIRSRGMPIDDDTMEAFRYQNMEQENSSRWESVLEIVVSNEYTTSRSAISFSDQSDDDWVYVPGQPFAHDQEVRAFLEEWSELRAEIHEITETSGAIWTEVHMDSFATLLPQVQSCREVARLLALEYEDALRRGDHDQAFHSLMAIIGTARSLEKEPSLISQLVHIAIGGIATKNLKIAIERDILDDQQLQSLLEQLRAFDDFGGKYQIAIVGERAMSQPIFDDLGRFGDEVGPLPSAFNERPIDALASLDVFEKAEKAGSEDMTVFFKQVTSLDQEFEKSVTEAGWLRKLETALTGLTVPALGAAGKAFIRSAMEVRLAKVGISLRLFEKQTGRWPESLNELSTSESGESLGPIDLVGSKPFGFRINESNAEIWGFDPQTPADSTPSEPTMPDELLEPGEQHLKYWYWNLPKGVNAEVSD